MKCNWETIYIYVFISNRYKHIGRIYKYINTYVRCVMTFSNCDVPVLRINFLKRKRCRNMIQWDQFLSQTGVPLETGGKLTTLKLQMNITIINNKNKRKPSENQNLATSGVLCGRDWNQNGSGMSLVVMLCSGMRWEGQPVHQTTTAATARPWQAQRDNLKDLGG